MLLCLSALNACSIFSVDKKIQYKDAEGHFDGRLFERIEENKTTSDWLLAHFGEPLFVQHGPDGMSICTWRFIREKKHNNHILILFRYSSTHEENRYLHTVIKNGLVLRRWRDAFEDVDSQLVFNAMGYRKHSPKMEQQNSGITKPMAVKESEGNSEEEKSGESIVGSTANAEASQMAVLPEPVTVKPASAAQAPGTIDKKDTEKPESSTAKVEVPGAEKEPDDSPDRDPLYNL